MNLSHKACKECGAYCLDEFDVSINLFVCRNCSARYFDMPKEYDDMIDNDEKEIEKWQKYNEGNYSKLEERLRFLEVTSTIFLYIALICIIVVFGYHYFGGLNVYNR